MKLFKLLKNHKCRTVGNVSVEITGLYHKDTEVKDGGLFFCLRGTNVDGTDYVKSAINNGAVAIVTEHEIQNLFGITQIIVKNARETMSQLACEFFGNPARKMKIIGVTGTNGKTTISTMIARGFEFAGKKVGIVGTNGIFISGKRYDAFMTTPDPIVLQFYFSKMLKAKCEYVCMEVSAHALDQGRVNGFKFDLVIFTNLSEDHLDYFKTMERYFEAKAKLFTPNHSKHALINIDDDAGKFLADCINIPFSAYSINEKSSYFASKIKPHETSQEFYFNNNNLFMINMMGRFNVSNALAAIAALRHFGIEMNVLVQAFEKMKPIDGRFNLRVVGGIKIVVDYAHTPDGLENLLKASRELAFQNRLVVVFGCGGNREVQKRPKMGEIASRLADFVIITSDNPRFEKREMIAKDIEKGVTSSNYLIELDRSKAIDKAVKMCESGDVVVIAGKGSENYIDENGEKTPYSDFEEIEKLGRC